MTQWPSAFAHRLQYSVHACLYCQSDEKDMSVWLNITETHIIYTRSQSRLLKTVNKHRLSNDSGVLSFEWTLHHQLGCIILPSSHWFIFPLWHTDWLHFSSLHILLSSTHPSMLWTNNYANTSLLWQHQVCCNGHLLT